MDVDVGQGMPAAAESSASSKVILLKGHEGDVRFSLFNMCRGRKLVLGIRLRLESHL